MKQTRNAVALITAALIGMPAALRVSSRRVQWQKLLGGTEIP
jgi:hypothetical protein